MSEYRIERDSMGEMEVPVEALYGAQTQRAVINFQISGLRMPIPFLRAMGLIKSAAAQVNADLGLLDSARAQAIIEAGREVFAGQHMNEFPVDVFQTGSGTSSNMNANEVVAALATRRLGTPVHPNDHVNMSQSSNDVVPTAIAVSASLSVHRDLLPSLKHLLVTMQHKAETLSDIVKTGRTHLMDAMPISFAQEIACWKAQLESNVARIEDSLKRLRQLPQGGTAVGTGINADPRFGPSVASKLSEATGFTFVSAGNLFEGIASLDSAVELSGQLNTLSCTLMKISNDLRWMNSGPLAGLGEIELPALQPGSSIMPGKVNPVIPEAVAMVCAQVIGNHTTITVAGQSGNFQLNVMMPVVAYNLLQSIELLGSACRTLADSAIAGFRVRTERLAEVLARNPILVTALNAVIGYEKGAAAAKKAYEQGRPIREVVLELTAITEEELDRLLDPSLLTRGGLPGAGKS